VADALLVESQRTLAKHFPQGPFWPLFHTCLEATIRGIMEVDERQRRPGAMNRRSLSLYADVASIFKVGCAAVCVRSGRMTAFRRVSDFADEISIAGQILDDMLDVQEDLARARYNFAANQLLRAGSVNADGCADRIARALLFDDGAGQLLKEASQHLDRADAAIAPLLLGEAMEYVGTLRLNINAFRQRIHVARVEHVFGPIAKAAGAMRGVGARPAGADRPRL
jgi:hypothetical protein